MIYFLSQKLSARVWNEKLVSHFWLETLEHLSMKASYLNIEKSWLFHSFSYIVYDWPRH